MDTHDLQKPTPTFSQPSKHEASPPREQIPSPLSSPTHEFTFTITLHPSPISTPTPAFPPSNKALDLCPADDIFPHGHLLPRPSVDQNLCRGRVVAHDRDGGAKQKKKSNSFSSLLRRKVCDLKHLILKACAGVIEPIFFSGGGKAKREIRRRPYSFSASSNPSSAKERRGWTTRRRGEFSAPASMRASPRNSGLLLATPAGGTSSASGESSMEELQSAIQAAIAHCKSSSIATKEIRQA